MRISLNKIIEKYHDKLGYICTIYGKNNKQFLQVENEDFAQSLIFHYDNLKLIRTKAQYAPEITKLFITIR